MALTENERTRGTNPSPTGRRPTLEEIQYGKKDDKNENNETKEEPKELINEERINEYFENDNNVTDSEEIKKEKEELKRKIKYIVKEINNIWDMTEKHASINDDDNFKYSVYLNMLKLQNYLYDLKKEYNFLSLENNISEEEIIDEIEEQKQGKHSPRPNHYQIQLPDGYKLNSILLIQSLLTPEEFRGFLKGNILKYVFREGKKNGLEDLKKLNTYNKWIINVMNNEPLEGIE